MANRLDKVASDVLSVNAAVKELSDRFDDYLFESAYGVLDTALPAGTRITTISLESALKGAIPVNAFFVISYPDGSNPLVIQNRKEELDTDTTDIEIYDDGTKDWEQDITPNVTYPVGSILSSVNYASNEGNLIGDLTGNVIFRINNDEGANIPAGSPIYSKGEIGQSDRIDVGICDANDSTKMPCIGIAMTTLTTTGDGAKGDAMLSGIFHTDITGFTSLAVGDILYIQNDGSLSQTKPTGETSLIQNVGVVLKTNGTTCQSLKVTAIGRTNDVPNLDENALFVGNSSNQAVATDCPMVSIIKAADGDAARTLVNADPAGTTISGYHPIQFNDDGDFGADSSALNLGYNDLTQVFSAQKIISLGNMATGGIFSADNIKIAQPDTTTAGDIGLGAEVVYFGTGTTAAGQIYYYSSSGWIAVDSDYSVGALGFLAVALGTSPTSNGMCIRGMVNVSGIEGSQQTGNVLYVSNTPGTSTTTNPSGQYDVVRVIGYALSSTSNAIYFNPSQDWVIHD